MFRETVLSGFHRITESFRLEKTFKNIESNHNRAGAPLLRGQAQGVGAAQPGEEKAPG